MTDPRDANEKVEEKKTEQSVTALVPYATDTGPLAAYFDKLVFDQCWRAAQLLSHTQLVPRRYQGKPEDCFLMLATARSLGANPLMVMSEIYVVFGTPSMSGKMVAGLVNASGIFEGPLNFRFSKERPALWCEAYTTYKGQEYSRRVEWEAHVVASGWHLDKKERDSEKTVKSKWITMREQMFCYRAASWFAKAFAPQVLMGMQTVEEVMDEHEEGGEPSEGPKVVIRMDDAPTEAPAPTETDRLAAEPASEPPQERKPRGRPARIHVQDKTEPASDALPLGLEDAPHNADEWAKGRE
jgi:hypothetical protein